MKEEITAESYRKNKLAELETSREWINKNYQVLWDLAKEAQIVMPEPLRIKTHYGDWTFVPARKITLQD